MPTGHSLQYIAGGDRTVPLPTTTQWQPPTPKPKFVWPVQEPTPPAPPKPPTPTTSTPTRRTYGPRRRPGPKPTPKPRCTDCGGPKSDRATRCADCQHTRRLEQRKNPNPTCTDCATPISRYCTRCPSCARKHDTAVQLAATQQLGTTTAAIRAWAMDNGHPVGDRGRLSPTIVAAYAQAHHKPHPGQTPNTTPNTPQTTPGAETNT